MRIRASPFDLMGSFRAWDLMLWIEEKRQPTGCPDRLKLAVNWTLFD